MNIIQLMFSIDKDILSLCRNYNLQERNQYKVLQCYTHLCFGDSLLVVLDEIPFQNKPPTVSKRAHL